MPDVYAIITEVEPELVGTVADAMELRARDVQQAMLEDYLNAVGFGDGVDVLEVGCGTGAITVSSQRGQELAR